jgi:hypothetical protein
MNIIQLHDQVLGPLDQARSGRISPTMIDSAINTAYDTLYKQRIGAENVVGPTGFYPGEGGRVKDSLKFFYENQTVNTTDSKVDINGILLGANKPVCSLLINIEINIGTTGTPKWITPSSINQKDKTEKLDNSFTAPRQKDWQVVYYIYDGKYVEFLLPENLNLCQIRIAYYRDIDRVYSGIMVNAADFSGDNITVIFYSPTSIYNNLKKFRTEEASINKSLFTIGTVVKSFSPVNIDPTMISQVVMSAARLISMEKIGVLNETEKN